MDESKLLYLEDEAFLTFISSISGGALRCSADEMLALDFISDGMLHILECTREEFFGKYDNKIDKLIYEEDCSFIADQLINCSIEDDWRELEHRVFTCFGKVKWVVSRCKKIADQQGQEWLYIHVEDIDDKKLARQRMTEQLRLDALTRLYNRDYTHIQVDCFLSGEGKDKSHAFMIIDIDNFKRINNQLGYLFGDTVLTNISDTLKNVFYESDIVGRIGGDEFIVFLKNIDNLQRLQEKASEVKNIFENTYSGEGKDLQISCSIGIARYPEDGTTFRELFKNADAALYQVKKKCGDSLLVGNERMEPSFEYENSEYYYPYSMDVVHTLKDYNFCKEITGFAFDIMAKTNDVNSAMKLLLEKVGNNYNASSVGILENPKKNDFIDIQYMWHRKKKFSGEKKFSLSEYQAIEKDLCYFDKNGILSISDCRTLPEGLHLGEMIRRTNAKAILLCNYFDDGKFCGCVYIEDNEKCRNWTADEKDSLITITKIISFYLLKYKVSEAIQEKLDKIKNFDSLTGLPTLHKFKIDTRKKIKEFPNMQYAIVYSDISNFKYVNDSYGYEVGDQMLSCFANLLSENSKEESVVARVSSDNFIAMVPYSDDESLKKHVVEINEKFNQLQKKRNTYCNTVIITGACVIRSEDNDIMVAIDNANIARKSVKGSSTTVCQLFDDQMKRKLKKELEILSSMEEALENREFQVYLQPKIDLYSNIIVGAEALVRWKREEGVMLPPDDFIPLFEKNGFIVNLDFYVYEEICKLLASWIRNKKRVVPISVNVSRVHLNNENFVQKVKDLVAKYSIPPRFLELELTESIFLNNTEIALSTMRELRLLGFGVSIDDFGAGYSSLNLLKDMATDVLKLDKEFFGEGELKREEQIIVSSIISMAKQLNMKVLSEGVETQIQSDFLKSISCDMAQGYLFARPMPIANFEVLLGGNTQDENRLVQWKNG